VNDLYRIVDANLNRVSEGLRVLEDIARFHLDDQEVCSLLKSLRHQVRALGSDCVALCLAARTADTDVGFAVSQETDKARETLAALTAANFKRAEEGLRVLEETLSLLGHAASAKECERLRFAVYTLESQYSALLRPHRAAALLDTDLYGITAEELSQGRTNLQVVSEMLEAGVKIIQYREKRKSFAEKYRECAEIRHLTQNAGATFIVNDHPDLALLCEADGVHLGQDDYPLQKVRPLVGETMLIGVSTHSPAQARQAVAEGADYIGVGPLFPTLTKGVPVQPVGLEYLDWVVSNLSIPFVALGGVTIANVGEVRRHGARLVALVKEIVSAHDIRVTIKQIREVLAQTSTTDCQSPQKGGEADGLPHST